MILINFKIYKETFGEGAIKYAKICKEVAEETKVKITPVVPAINAYKIIKEVGIEVYLQEFTEGAVEAGAAGSLLNHSDHRLKPGMVKKLLKQWPKDFESVLCFSTLGQLEKWVKKLKPSYLAYEPKELIGNREKSVSSEYAKTIKKIVKLVSPTPVLVGAGIHCHENVKVALELGAKGVLVATDIVKASDPKAELLELARAFSGV